MLESTLPAIILPASGAASVVRHRRPQLAASLVAVLSDICSPLTIGVASDSLNGYEIFKDNEVDENINLNSIFSFPT
jgi:hypothetical protein